jgi:hypothetical protein
MPVDAAKINDIAGIYRSQCAVPKPVSHIPAHIVEPDTTKKNLMALLILYLLIISSFSTNLQKIICKTSSIFFNVLIIPAA